jgi:hypothetical protein
VTVNAETSAEPVLSFSFNLNDRVNHEITAIIDNTEVTIGAEPVASRTRSLTGDWRIHGSNGLVSMEYYITLTPLVGGYTKITSAYGLAISAILTDFENETINIVRSNETATLPAIAEGYAKFHYLGNQWVSIWTTTGGVRATIMDDIVTMDLY